MKTLTCRQLGGPCDQEISAESWDDMVKAMTSHVLENHPDTAKEMEEMHKDDPAKWGKDNKPKWDSAPDRDPSEEKDDETELPEDNEAAKENMFGQDEDDVMEDPAAPRIIEDR
jgi:predicted small metal-binding protein